MPGGFSVRAGGTLGNFVIAVFFDEFSLLKVGQAYSFGVVITEVAADTDFEIGVVHQQLVDLAADGPSLVELAELEVVGGIRLHLPVVGLYERGGVPVAAFDLAGQDPALGIAVGGRVQRAEGIGAGSGAD